MFQTQDHTEEKNRDETKFLLPEIVRSVNEFCQPLINSNNINFFYFARIFDNGTCQILAHSPDPIKYIFEYNIKPTSNPPEELVRESFWFMVPRNNENSRALDDFKTYFNIGSMADYIDRYAGFYEMYCFGTRFDQTDLAAGIFLNQKDALHDFIHRFRKQANIILSQNPDHLFTLPEAMRPDLKGMLRRTKDPDLERVMNHIENDLFGKLELEKIAKQCGMSRSTLIKKFRNEIKKSPYSYIKDRRLDEAMKFLLSGKYSVSEVGNLIGYENFGAFTQAFKMKFEKPPSYFKG